jgi:ligand-binding sensor domain-containing protein
VVADPRGGVWLGTKNRGLFQWKDQKFSTVALPSRLSRRTIQALMLSASGDLWIGADSADALFRLRDGKLESLPLPPEHGNVCALAEEPDGTIWAGTNAGLLLRVNGDALLNLTPKLSRAKEAICCLHAAPDGSLWIGYEKRGLGRLKAGKFAIFGPTQGIEEQSISQILHDDRGWLWCADHHGIFRMKLAELEAVAEGRLEKVQPIFNGRGEGWPMLQASGEFWPRALRSSTGEICMSTYAGIAVIRSEREIENPPPPAVVIERLHLNGQPFAAYESRIISGREQNSPLLDLHGLKERISLGKGVRQLGVEFGVISFSGQENVRYRYRL